MSAARTPAVRIRPLATLLLAALSLAACKQEMVQQRRMDTYEANGVWRDGTTARPVPAGTVSRTALSREAAATTPPPVTPALLQHGAEVYGTFCTPCHGLAGEGDGMIVQRGFPHPPSYHTQRLRAVPAQYLYDVITDGYGVMYSYASRIEPADRWAIVAYVRALQLSRHATVDEAPEAPARIATEAAEHRLPQEPPPQTRAADGQDTGSRSTGARPTEPSTANQTPGASP